MITIEKAIESIIEVTQLDCHVKYPEWQEALQLGIEALKYVKAMYDPDHQMMRKLLPGETLE